jgi:4-hydroxybenzoate polyprenyltransferase
VGGRWSLFITFLFGAFAMRSAGCVYNDIVDRDLDRQVERTRLRPLASGRVSPQGAWALLICLALIGLFVLLQLERTAQVIAFGSLALVAAYPFMKRLTWWPQAWLGLVFSWGALVGWPAVTGDFSLPALMLWLGSIFWVIGYDTIYAIQDIEDDAMVGVQSSARAMGTNVRSGVGICYVLAVVGWSAAVWQVFPDPLALVGLLPAALHLAWQAYRIDMHDGVGALALFRANRTTGLLMFAATLAIGLSAAA